MTTASGTVRLPEGVLEKGQALVARFEGATSSGARGSARQAPTGPQSPSDRITRVDLRWFTRLPDGGRHGFTPSHRTRLEAALPPWRTE